MGMTVGRLAAKYGLSRSTLLYYDAIGLLKAAGHQAGEYRQYSEDDEQRLAQICRYREAGIPLKEIQLLLQCPGNGFASILEQRFAELNEEIRRLYGQQRLIAGLLQNAGKISESGVMTKKLWVLLLQQSGFSEQDMEEWHSAFEQTAPENHQLFLEHLQIPDEEIAAIRRMASKAPSPKQDMRTG